MSNKAWFEIKYQFSFDQRAITLYVHYVCIKLMYDSMLIKAVQPRFGQNRILSIGRSQKLCIFCLFLWIMVVLICLTRFAMTLLFRYCFFISNRFHFGHSHSVRAHHGSSLECICPARICSRYWWYIYDCFTVLLDQNLRWASLFLNYFTSHLVQNLNFRCLSHPSNGAIDWDTITVCLRSMFS